MTVQSRAIEHLPFSSPQTQPYMVSCVCGGKRDKESEREREICSHRELNNPPS